MLKSEFEAFLADEIAKQKGVYYPVKANMVERLSITTAPPKQLHPNPMDDFCRAEVGPSYLIINEYVKKIRDTPDFASSLFDEPILVEKVRPDGYRILNGHHRWAAALNVGVKKVPIDIVNLAHSTDIRKVLERSQHDRRVTFDMDEVILHPKGDVPMEEPLGFPYNIRYKKQKRIRLGVPALFDFLKKTGYDIYVCGEIQIYAARGQRERPPDTRTEKGVRGICHRRNAGGVVRTGNGRGGQGGTPG